MPRTLLLLMIGSVTAVMLTIPAMAQSIDPKQYFDKDYAVAPEYRPQNSVPSVNLPGRGGVKSPSGDTSTARSYPSTPQETANSAQAQQGGAPQMPVDNRPKTTLSVVVNSLELEHLTAVVKKVESLAKSKRVSVLSVMHIGTPENMSAAMTELLYSLDIGVVYTEVLPTDLPIATSPTWIFQTAQGKYIVEGGMDPERFISPSGDYVAVGLPSSAPVAGNPPRGNNPGATMEGM